MKIKTIVVDAFTQEAFKGNPAGVCILTEPLSEDIMQKIAGELKHSETAFVQPFTKDQQELSIRYFTPTVEIAFCGHATLGTSKVLLEKYDRASVNFLTHHGLKLSARKFGSEIAMRFPNYKIEGYTVKPAMKALLNTEILHAGYSTELEMLLIQVKDKNILRSFQPDFQKMIEADADIKELVITCSSDNNEYDFYSRCFCPWIGINEDPVTGAAHSILTDFWGKKLGKTKMKAYQLSERGGYLNLEIISDSEIEVVSNAKIVLEGEISI